jgi:hypothetical protein
VIQGAKTNPYYRIIEDDLYMHADLLGLKTERDWVHFDMTKVSESSWLRSAFEGGATDTTVGIVTATKLSDSSYAGTIDLHLVQDKTRYDTPKADLGDQIDAMGDADASAVPFVARVDDQGRMTFLEMTTKRTVGRETCFTTQVMSMDDFGKPVSVKAPAANTVQEATDAQYRSL